VTAGALRRPRRRRSEHVGHPAPEAGIRPTGLGASLLPPACHREHGIFWRALAQLPELGQLLPVQTKGRRFLLHRSISVGDCCLTMGFARSPLLTPNPSQSCAAFRQESEDFLEFRFGLRIRAREVSQTTPQDLSETTYDRDHHVAGFALAFDAIHVTDALEGDLLGLLKNGRHDTAMEHLPVDLQTCVGALPLGLCQSVIQKAGDPGIVESLFGRGLRTRRVKLSGLGGRQRDNAPCGLFSAVLIRSTLMTKRFRALQSNCRNNPSARSAVSSSVPPRTTRRRTSG